MKLGEFNVIYGRNLVEKLAAELSNKTCLIVTMPTIWDLYGELFNGLKSFKVHFVDTMEESVIDRIVEKNTDFDTVIGFGGGMSIDMGKYFAWKQNKPIYVIPTIVSVDACFSYPIAVRRNGCVKYVGIVFPEAIYVDYGIIQSAPTLLNRSGLGDALSCMTGLKDWEIMHSADPSMPWDDTIALKTKGIIHDIDAKADEIKDVSETGIKTLIESYKWVGVTSYKNGYCYFEEGSEHYFAYAFESLFPRHYLHGQLVCLGVFLMTRLQNNSPEKACDIIKRAGIPIGFGDLDITPDMVRDTLKILNDYVITEKLPYSILNEKKINENFIESCIKALTEMEGN